MRAIRPTRLYGPHGSYLSWQEAAENSSPYKTSFDVVEGIRAEVIAGTHEPADFTGVHLAALLSLPGALRILDFGGGIGIGYTRAKMSTPEKIKWWRIVDLHDVVTRGRDKYADQALSFHESIDAAANDDRPDVILSNGAFQCVADPYPFIEKLFGLGAPRVVFSRLPVGDAERFAVFHTVSGDLIPWRNVRRDKLETLSGGYRLLYEILLPPISGDRPSDEFSQLYVKT